MAIPSQIEGRRLAGVLLAASLTLVSLGCPRPVPPPPPAKVPFSEVVPADPGEYTGYQVKVTYTGIQTKTIPTLLLVGESRAPAVEEFVPYRSDGVHYGNDDSRLIDLTVAGATIQRLVEAVGRRPALSVSGGGPEPVVSLMIERGRPPDEKVFEHLCDEIDADRLVDLVEAAASGEPAATLQSIRIFRNITVGPR